MQPHEEVAAAGRVDWGKALIAGLIATVAITVTMALSGQNVMKMLGGMIVPGGGAGVQYAVGGALHLAVGLIYGLLYAWLLGPVRRRGPVLKGLLYGAALTGVALAMMPAAAAMMGAGGDNPCNPCAAVAANACNPCYGSAAGNPCHRDAAAAGAANPCNPCAAGAAANPCNPCAAVNPCNPCAASDPGNPCAVGNPCNPCGAHAANPCNPCHASAASEGPNGDSYGANPCSGAGNACGAGSPCGGGGSATAGLVSLLNHLVYGLALALVYGRS